MLLFDGQCLFAFTDLPRFSVCARSLVWAVPAHASAPFGRSGSLVIDGLVVGTREALTHHPAVNETVNNQGPPGDLRFSVSDTSTGISRPGDGERVYIYATRGSG